MKIFIIFGLSLLLLSSCEERKIHKRKSRVESLDVCSETCIKSADKCESKYSNDVNQIPNYFPSEYQAMVDEEINGQEEIYKKNATAILNQFSVEYSEQARNFNRAKREFASLAFIHCQKCCSVEHNCQSG